MDTKNIIPIKDFLRKYKEDGLHAESCVTDIIGVLIDLKPAALMDFSSREMKKVDRLEFKNLLEKAGLKCVFYCHQLVYINKLEWFEEVFISKNFNTAVKLHNAFIKMWGSLDDFGQVIDKKTWVKTTRQIGKILGYPDTAVDGFIIDMVEHRGKEDSLTIIKDRYESFAHSKKHFDEEVKLYDEPLREAVKKYAPEIYKLSNK